MKLGKCTIAIALGIASVMMAGCSLQGPLQTPFSFTDVELFTRQAADGANELVISYGIENRSDRRLRRIHARGELYREAPEPGLLLAVDTESRVDIAAGDRGTVEVVLNPLLHFDPRPDLFLDGFHIRRLRYESGEPWNNFLGFALYPYRVPLREAAHEETT